MDTSNNSGWARSFKARTGRAPRVLHIGNIANNAYNNAKLLIEVGFDCDVICYDYYHIMGCPEWEDADFENILLNDFYPDWRDVNLNGFVRPIWFVQGPVDLCVAFLLARKDQKYDHAKKLQLVLALFNHSISLNLQQRINMFTAGLRHRFGAHLRRKLRRATTLDSNHLAVLINQRLLFVGLLGATVVARVFVLIRDCLKGVVRALGLNQWHWAYLRTPQIVPPIPNSHSAQQFLCEKWATLFPEGCVPPSKEDLLKHPANSADWMLLLKSYDIIIGYSTDPIYPMLAGVPYFAFEHGTLRHIPYQDDYQGRITAASYHEATHVFVTNFDCVASAERLVGNRYTFINHPFDDDHGQNITGGLEQRTRLKLKLDADLIFFFPTRQDWVEGNGYADKANDVFFRAMATLRATGVRVGAVCCNWGRNVMQSKALIKSLSLDAHVEWTSPLPVIPFERMCIAADIVVDQFKLGAFGGVVFKAMAVGAPVLTYLNEPLLKAQYPVLPPVINCRTEQDIVEQISVLRSDALKLKTLGRQSKEWISTHHAKKDTVNLQIDQFQKVLADITTHGNFQVIA